MQALYGGLYLSMYNTAFVGLPILVYSVTEKTYSACTLSGNPELYRGLRGDARMTWGEVGGWFVLGEWGGVGSGVRGGWVSGGGREGGWVCFFGGGNIENILL